MPEKTETAVQHDKSIEATPTKASPDGNVDATTPETPKYNLSKFRLKRILNNNSVRKSVALLGTFPDVSDSDAAIIVFEKQAFRESDVATPHNKPVPDLQEEPEKPTYFSSDLKVSKEFVNNIYGSYQCQPSAELNGVKVSVVYPATDKHIEKYSICQKYVINETPELYKSITLPYIESNQFTLNWVYNILEHKQESERIVYEDEDPETGFILLPDLKWDGRNVESLYLLGITHKRGIKSLRDLNASHLPLLRKLRIGAAKAIAERYGIQATQLRMYFHYQPSFYHLHVHINPVRNDAPGIWCEKSHMLDTVINNLELLPDYYERASLPFVLYEGNKLLDLYEEKMDVRKSAELIAPKEDKLPESKAEKASEDEPASKRLKLAEVAEPNGSGKS